MRTGLASRGGSVVATSLCCTHTSGYRIEVVTAAGAVAAGAAEEVAWVIRRLRRYFGVGEPVASDGGSSGGEWTAVEEFKT